MSILKAVVLVALIYILIGIILDRWLTYSIDNEPYLLMIFYWPVVLLVVFMVWIVTRSKKGKENTNETIDHASDS